MSQSVKKFFSIALVYGFLLWSGLAHAIPFENISWKSPGDNLITRYTGAPLSPPNGTDPYDATNLEWLNVGLTLGQSFNAVLDQTKLGGQFDGFRYATVYEIVGLFRGPLGYADLMIQSGESPQNILDFSALTGVLIQGPPGCCVAGALYDYPQSISSHTGGMLVYGDYGTSSINQAVFDKYSAFPMLGSFLVREQVFPVPEPESWTLLLSGLALIGWMRRRGRH